MGQIQTCYVCGEGGLLVDTQIYVSVEEDGPVMLGQCPRCHRFICTQHGEKLGAAGEEKKSWFSFGRGKMPTTRVVGCPFDPGVPLGREGG